MRLSRIYVLATTMALLVLGAWSGTGPSAQDPAEQPDSTAVAVVELFTSEGCSSCPPADRLLRSLVESARSNDRPIYALSFHVDYWNRLGWEDPYSDAAYSQRQRRYARALGVDTYTPQVVVNGRHALVGSRAGEVHDAIASALGTPARVDVSLTARTKGDTVSVDYRLSEAASPDASLRLAVVERGLSQNVTRGENAGRTLRHANVVRTFRSVPARTEEGTASLSLPDAVDRSEASIVGYVQGPSLAVLGAARVDLGKSDA